MVERATGSMAARKPKERKRLRSPFSSQRCASGDLTTSHKAPLSKGLTATQERHKLKTKSLWTFEATESPKHSGTNLLSGFCEDCTFDSFWGSSSLTLHPPSSLHPSLPSEKPGKREGQTEVTGDPLPLCCTSPDLLEGASWESSVSCSFPARMYKVHPSCVC